MKNKKLGSISGTLAILIALLSCALITPQLYWLISTNGVYPSGSDTMYHIFRGDMLYRAFVNGEGYPLYNRFWYNGIEPMRYWPPLSPILYAVCQYAAGGKVFTAFIYYVCVIFIGGVITWLYIGFKRKRPVLGAVLGVLWFFLPNNIYATFGEGNLPRSLSMVFLPIALYSVYSYLDSGEAKDLFRLIVSYVFIIMCHLGYAGMVALAILGYLLVQRLYTHNRRRMLKVVISIIIAFMITGIYMIPSLYGGIATNNADTVKTYFQSIFITLNPFYRITDTNVTFYFGLSAFIIAVFGTLVSNKKASPGFLNAIIIVLMTTSTAYSIIKIMPGSNMMWMLRFLSIALCMVFLSLIYWEKLRKWILILFIIMLCADSVPSLSWIYGDHSSVTPQMRLTELSDETYVTKAQELCTQRIAMFDLSSLGAQGAYIISNYGNPKMAVFGAGWEAAVTADYLTRLNRAMNDEYFDYMFDRCIDLGADTIIVQKSQAVYGERTLIRLDAAAARSNYELLYENDDYMLYRLPVTTTFGTRSQYDAIGIGYSAFTLSFAFPNIRETVDEYIDHYTFEELSRYKTVYLSGFYYEDKNRAEELVRRLSENGVRIVILADGMPEDRQTRTRTFLGVTCNVIQFENGYPILYTTDYGEMDCDLFPRGYSKWVTCYLNGLKDVKGTISDNNVILSFFGTGINENVCYVGLNIPFYYYLTQDMNAEKIMEWVMGMEPGQLPDKELYPIDISYRADGISIHSDYDMIKTGVAYHDNFRGNTRIYDDNHILVVQRGNTDIHFVYPYLGRGLLVTFLGILFMILFLVYIYNAHQRDEALRAAGKYGRKRIKILKRLLKKRTEEFSGEKKEEKTEEEPEAEEETEAEEEAVEETAVEEEIAPEEEVVVEEKIAAEEEPVAEEEAVLEEEAAADEETEVEEEITAEEEPVAEEEAVLEEEAEAVMIAEAEKASEAVVTPEAEKEKTESRESIAPEPVEVKAEEKEEKAKRSEYKPKVEHKPETDIKPEAEHMPVVDHKPKVEHMPETEIKPEAGYKPVAEQIAQTDKKQKPLRVAESKPDIYEAQDVIERLNPRVEVPEPPKHNYDLTKFDLPFVEGDDFDIR